MSHHLSGPNLRPPRGDARLDLTDTFAFTNGDKTVLIMNVNPYAPVLADAFHPDAVYQVNVDTTGGNVADRVYSVTFSPPTERTQTYSVWMADAVPTSAGSYGSEIVTGAQAGLDGTVRSAAVDGLTVWAGLRSDPFFADLEGILNDFKWTGRDAMANCNVFSIVLEIPTTALGDTSQIGVWSRVSLVEDGGLTSVDRGAHPSLTAYFNAEEVKDAYNAGSPDTDLATYLDTWTAVLAHTGHYATEAAHQALAVVLPDVLRYDRSAPAAYPNGRTPTDDVTDARLAMVSGGAITGDNIGPHGDLLDSFPYLGEPHPTPDGPPAS
ncbi:DUF4331 family protein [Nocardioides sp. LML1-1-1.1]|uniref:DUF4331 family protein n=1 Tax=Nocardioides sp. LML1-1-1.1 TaxID=3135248 RepID=UPI00341AC80D